MKLASYLGLLHRAEQSLAASFRQVSNGHGHEPDVHFLCQTLAAQCDRHVEALHDVVQRYGEDTSEQEPERFHPDELDAARSGPVGLLRDLQDVYTLATFVDCTWMMVRQAAEALRDAELLDVIGRCEKETTVQIAWLKTRMKQAAPQALVAAR